ncbi:hypothetical protein PLESTM_002000100 [Pleodorina starrii]|nr:hypothetical protein PLESTM_002000100 [Pleodorina starrii]
MCNLPFAIYLSELVVFLLRISSIRDNAAPPATSAPSQAANPAPTAQIPAQSPSPTNPPPASAPPASAATSASSAPAPIAAKASSAAPGPGGCWSRYITTATAVTTAVAAGASVAASPQELPGFLLGAHRPATRASARSGQLQGMNTSSSKLPAAGLCTTILGGSGAGGGGGETSTRGCATPESKRRFEAVRTQEAAAEAGRRAAGGAAIAGTHASYCRTGAGPPAGSFRRGTPEAGLGPGLLGPAAPPRGATPSECTGDQAVRAAREVRIRSPNGAASPVLFSVVLLNGVRYCPPPLRSGDRPLEPIAHGEREGAVARRHRRRSTARFALR